MEKKELIKGLSELLFKDEEEKFVCPKITVITICHNQLSHTKRFIDSLLRFTARPFQVIVVNNGSTDETREYLRSKTEWLSKDEAICVLNLEENLGWVGGINKALDFVDLNSEFVVFANNDVVVDKDWNIRLLKHFDATVGAVGPTSNYVSGRQHKIFDHPGIVEEETNYLIGFFMCVRRSIVNELGPLDDLHSFSKEDSRPSGGDDLDYSIRIRNLGYRLMIARDVFVWHAGAVSNKSKLTDKEYNQLCSDANKALAEKWGDDVWEELVRVPTKVLCAVPLRGDWVHRKFAFTLSTLVKPFHWEVADIPRAHIESARNAAVKFAIDGGFTHILFLDDDHILPADLFTRLWKMNVPVACSLAFQRVPPYHPCVYKWGTNKDGDIACLSTPEIIKTGVQEVDASGFSGVLIRMDVFDKLSDMKLGWFKWGKLGEDIQFCLNCRDAKIPIYCDTDLILPHIGENLEVDEGAYYAFNHVEAKR